MAIAERFLGLLLVACVCESLCAQTAEPSNYRGWRTLKLSNGLVELQVVPEIGGRVIQIKLDDYEYLFVNDELAGRSPPPSGVGPEGEWLNYGGEKLWPAPQGRGIPGMWDGPPDPVLDGSPHTGTILQASGNRPAIRLVSRDDPRSGIRFSREIRLFRDTSRVRVEATMTNIDTKPRHWGIWSVMQHNAANRSGAGYDQNMRVYCPIRPGSIYPKGYNVMRGPEDHTSFALDPQGKTVVAHFERKMGKIRVDCAAGWVATVHGSAGCVLVERFPYYPEREYPDQASVEVWLHGPYGPMADQTDPKTFPFFLESELVSPFAQLAPGESYTFAYEWYAAALGDDFPILDCTEAGVVCEPLTVTAKDGHMAVAGRFGVFYRGTARLAYSDDAGNRLGQAVSEWKVSPDRPLVLAETLAKPPKAATTVSLIVDDVSGRSCGCLATADIVTDEARK